LKQLSLLDRLRIWAALTGLALVAWHFGAMLLGLAAIPAVPLLICGIGGFELFLSIQDIMTDRKDRQQG
jgi:zinc transporter ZupT